MSDKAKKIIKIVLIVLTLIAFIGLVYHFVRAISLSLFEDDIKTAQNRIRSAYAFLMMLSAGLVCVVGLIFVFNIKVRVFPSCISKFFGLDEGKELEEDLEDIPTINEEEKIA